MALSGCSTNFESFDSAPNAGPVAIEDANSKSESGSGSNSGSNSNGSIVTGGGGLSVLVGLWTESPEARAALVGAGVPFCRIHVSPSGAGVPTMGIYEIFPDGSFYQLLLLPQGDEDRQIINFRGIRTQLANGLAKFYIGRIRSNGVLDFTPEAAVLLDSKGGRMTSFVQSLKGKIRVYLRGGRLFFGSTRPENEDSNEIIAATTQHLQGLGRIGVYQMNQYRMQIQLCRKTMPPAQKPALSPTGFQEIVDVD